VTVLSEKELDQFTYKPSMIYDKRVQKLGLEIGFESVTATLAMLRDIQRPIAGAKQKNIAPYAEYQVAIARREQLGLVPPRILWTAGEINFTRMNGQTVAAIPAGVKAYFLDGETGKAAADEATRREPLVADLDVPVIWFYGLTRDFASQAHHDLNLLGTRPSVPVALNLDRRDPLTDIAKRIGKEGGALAGFVVFDKRQVSVADAANGRVMTLASLRGFVAGVALGKTAIGRATAPIRRDDVEDLLRVEQIASAYARKIAEHRLLGKHLADRESMLSVGAVQVALGALAHDIACAKKSADEISRDDASIDELDSLVGMLAKVKWARGNRWAGIGGKVNPTTGKFSVGGSKEYGYAIHRALTDQEDPGYRQVRA
jgi:hypothetical protein